MEIIQWIIYIRTMQSNDIRLNNHNIFQLNNNESQERLI